MDRIRIRQDVRSTLATKTATSKIPRLRSQGLVAFPTEILEFEAKHRCPEAAGVEDITRALFATITSHSCPQVLILAAANCSSSREKKISAAGLRSGFISPRFF
uniref:Uncharacterized protein n=1 Tax=Candidozyma auris TaxID=498019 RepID=A0A0L0P3F5_CANAR